MLCTYSSTYGCASLAGHAAARAATLSEKHFVRGGDAACPAYREGGCTVSNELTLVAFEKNFNPQKPT